MNAASFATMAAASAHRRHHGGWLFATADGSRVLWFDLSHTPTTVFSHHMTHGISGRLL